MAKLLANEILRFEGFQQAFQTSRYESYTGLQLFQLEDGKILAITNQLEQNQGTSVPNVVEDVARAIVSKFNLDPAKFRLIDYSAAELSVFATETFHEAPLEWDGSHFFLSTGDAWPRMSRSAVEELIGQPY